MIGLNLSGSRQIGDRPPDFQDFIVRPGREAKFINSHLQKFLAFFIQWTILFDLPVVHVGVGINARVPESFLLGFSGVDGSFLDLSGRLGSGGVGKHFS